MTRPPITTVDGKEREENAMPRKVKGYTDGYEYGARTVATMQTRARIQDNIDHVRASEYIQPGSPTRAYWLGFVRALRAA